MTLSYSPLARACLLGLALTLPICLSWAQADTINNLEGNADRWIELELRMAEALAGWKSEQTLLQSSLQVLLSENASLNEELQANEAASALFNANKTRLEEAIGEQEAILGMLASNAQSLEETLRGVVAYLPKPLMQDIRPLLQKLTAQTSGEPASVAARMQGLVSILTQIDQFNNKLTLTHELLGAEDGSEVDVTILYWGLAVAYAIDASGNRAWIVLPRENGWEWRNLDGKADSVAKLIAVFEKREQPAMANLPVEIN